MWKAFTFRKENQPCPALTDQVLRGFVRARAGTITPLMDLWVEEKRLPNYLRLVPKAK